MSLDHDGFNFYGHIHGPVVRPQAPQLQIAIRQVFGIKGEFHILGEQVGTDLACLMTMDGYNTTNLLQADLVSIQSKSGKLTGDLTEFLTNGGQRIFQNCTFVGADEIGELFLDGSGANGWVQRILLRWRSRSPVS